MVRLRQLRDQQRDQTNDGDDGGDGDDRCRDEDPLCLPGQADPQRTGIVCRQQTKRPSHDPEPEDAVRHYRRPGVATPTRSSTAASS